MCSPVSEYQSVVRERLSDTELRQRPTGSLGWPRGDYRGDTQLVYTHYDILVTKIHLSPTSNLSPEQSNKK